MVPSGQIDHGELITFLVGYGVPRTNIRKIFDEYAHKLGHSEVDMDKAVGSGLRCVVDNACGCRATTI